MAARRRAVNIPELETDIRRIMLEDPAGAPQKVVALVHSAVIELDKRKMRRSYRVALAALESAVALAGVAVGLVLGYTIWGR